MATVVQTGAVTETVVAGTLQSGSISTTNGNAIMVAVGIRSNSATVTSVTDDAGNSYVQLRRQTSSGTAAIEVWATNATSPVGLSGQTITVQLSAATFLMVYRWLEISGANNTGLVDQLVSAGSAISGTAAASGTTPALTNASELAFGFVTNSYSSSPRTFSAATFTQGTPSTSWPSSTTGDQSATVSTGIELTSGDLIIADTTGQQFSATINSASVWASVVIVISDALTAGWVSEPQRTRNYFPQMPYGRRYRWVPRPAQSVHSPTAYVQPLTATVQANGVMPVRSAVRALAATLTGNAVIARVFPVKKLAATLTANAAIIRGKVFNLAATVLVGGTKIPQSGPERVTLDAAVSTMAQRVFWPAAVPSGASLIQGGCPISYQGTPLEAPGDWANTSYNGNGYGYFAMSPQTGPTTNAHSASPGSTSTAITKGHIYTGQSITIDSPVATLKGQMVEVNDGVNSWRFVSKNAVTAPVSGPTTILVANAFSQSISSATAGTNVITLDTTAAPTLEVGMVVAFDVPVSPTETLIVQSISGVTVTTTTNIVNSGHDTGNLRWGMVAPYNFAIGTPVKLVWDVAVLETFRGLQDSPDPSQGPGTTAVTQVTDTWGTLNIDVSYTPSCPFGIGDGFTTPNYKLLIRPAKFDLTQVNATSFQQWAVTATNSSPVTWTINTAYDGGPNALQYTSSNVTAFNNPPHDIDVDLRMVRMFSAMNALLGETTYQTNYLQLRDIVAIEFDNTGGGLRPWQNFLILDMAGWDSSFVSSQNQASKVTGTGNGGKTWEQLALQYVRDLLTNNYNLLAYSIGGTTASHTLTGVGFYVDSTAGLNPTPSTYATGTTLGAGLTSGTAPTTLSLAGQIGTALTVTTNVTKAVLVSESTHNQVFYLATSALATDTTLTPVTGQKANFAYTTAATVKPCNAPVGQSRFEYTCEAAALFYLCASRRWVDGTVTSGEQANWKAAGDSIIAKITNITNTSTHLPYQQTYIDIDQSGNAAYTPVNTLGSAPSCKPADVGDGVYHLLLANLYGPNATALTVAKNIITALYAAPTGDASTPLYDAVNHGFWSQVQSDSTNVQGGGSNYKESGRLAYWLGAMRLLNNIIEPGGTWTSKYLDWQDFVFNKSFQVSPSGWTYRTFGNYAPYSTTYNANGAHIPFTVFETWITMEASGLAVNQLIDDVRTDGGIGGPPSGGSVSTLTRDIARPIAATLTGNAVKFNTAARALAATLTGNAAIVRATVHRITATLSENAAAVRAKVHTLSATLTANAGTAKGAVRSLAATLTGNAAMTKASSRSLAATLTGNAAIGSRSIIRALTATAQTSGTVVRSLARKLAATLVDNVTSFDISFHHGILTQNFTATMQANAATARSTARSLAATLTASASQARATGKRLAATVTSNASQARATVRGIAATVIANLAEFNSGHQSILNFTATIQTNAVTVRSAVRGLPATLTASAATARAMTRPLAASLMANAVSIRSMVHNLTASMTANASVARSTARALVASITANAAIAAASHHVLNLVASITANAASARSVVRGVSATLTANAATAKVMIRSVSATLTANVTIVRAKVHTLAASLTANATVARSTVRGLSATLTANAANTRSAIKGLTATLTANASNARAWTRGLTASITANATIVRAKVHVLAASLTTNAVAIRVTVKGLAANLMTNGAIGRTFTHTMTATLQASGSIARGVARALVAALTASGAIARGLTRQLSAKLKVSGKLKSTSTATVSGDCSVTVAQASFCDITVTL